MIFTGYYEDRKGYRSIHPETYKVVKSRDIVFFEKKTIQKTPCSEETLTQVSCPILFSAEGRKEIENKRQKDVDDGNDFQDDDAEGDDLQDTRKSESSQPPANEENPEKTIRHTTRVPEQRES